MITYKLTYETLYDFPVSIVNIGKILFDDDVVRFWLRTESGVLDKDHPLVFYPGFYMDCVSFTLEAVEVDHNV